MKFKLKFEIVYDNIEKDILRDMKIQSLLNDVSTEVISDVPITPPNKEDTIFLKNTEYIIKSISHIVDDESYTTLIRIENRKSFEMTKRREQEEILKKICYKM
jgi:hypothetical protein